MYGKNHKRKNKTQPTSRLFWDERYDEIDWRKNALGVIARVLHRGDQAEYEELIRFYGRDRIIHALTKEYCVLPNFMLEEVAGYFGLKKEELSCYRWRQEHGYRWI